jgi:hypothetical protein
MASADALRDPATYRLLARHGMEVALAVRPADLSRVGAWVELASAHGVRAAVWPMIDDAAGRWLSCANVAPFAELVREVRGRAPGVELVFDLEPPLPLVRGALDGERRALRGLWSLVRATPERRAAELAIEALCAEVAARGALTLAIVPFVLFDGARHRGGWARLCGGPAGLAATRVNVMLYTSLIQGYSRGALDRDDARSLLLAGCEAAVTRFGPRASVSLGAVGLGALGDEPVYADPEVLAEDAAIAQAAGVRDLWLFDLGGALSRGSPERWLAALARPAEGVSVPRLTPRARAASAVMWGLGRVLGAG